MVDEKEFATKSDLADLRRGLTAEIRAGFKEQREYLEGKIDHEVASLREHLEGKIADVHADVKAYRENTT